MQVGKGFEYALIDKRDHKFIMGSFSVYSSRLIDSRHQIPMTGFQGFRLYCLVGFIFLMRGT